MLTTLSHNSLGELKVDVNGVEYTYFGLSPFFLEKALSAIRYQNHKRFFDTVKSFSYIKQDNTKHLKKQEQLNLF